jgi:prephenate dehydrogenase
MKTVGVIGLGLIGGSMALDLKRRGFAARTLGVERDSVAAEAARTIGLVDEVVSLDECIRRAGIIVLAVPVGTAVKLATYVLDNMGDDKIVIDVCSTKEQICRAVQYHPRRPQFVSTHPMAGTEYSGPWAAQPGLFDGRACIFCNSEESSPRAVKEIEEMYAVLNMRPLYMRADQHDVHTAYVSHISHVTSFALALTVLDKEKDEKHIFDLASGGFSSTVRLAKSNADMWVPILTQNHDNVLQVMDTYIEKMKAFRQAVADYDEDRIRQLIEEANRIKRILR